MEDSGRRSQDQDRGAVADFIIVRYHCEVNKRIVFLVPPYDIVIIGTLVKIVNVFHPSDDFLTSHIRGHIL